MARRKVIIDTDPGVDDVLALLFALSSPSIEILAITSVHGNIDLLNTTRNTITLFNVLYEAHRTGDTSNWIERIFKDDKIILAAGAKVPLVPDKQLDASYFHGRDGLGGVSEVFPQYLPDPGWESSFPALRTPETGAKVKEFKGITASQHLAHEEILSILQREETASVTIIALGPLTNLSLAIRQDYRVFSKVAEVVVMGGALRVPGNVTPTSEFNFLADAEAASHVLSYTSADPSSTHHFATPRPIEERDLPRLKVTLLALDTTTRICLSHTAWNGARQSLLKEWCDVFVNRTFRNASTLYTDKSIEKVNLSMHDPACIWYLLANLDTTKNPGQVSKEWRVEEHVDVRVECTGTWTRGACVVDDRGRERIMEGLEDAGSDEGNWLHRHRGNRVRVVTATPESRVFCEDALGSIFAAI